MTSDERLVRRVLRADRQRRAVLDGARQTSRDVGGLAAACALDDSAWTLISTDNFLARAWAAERLCALFPLN